MNCGHLFNGIGGFALAAHWMGWENIMHCEIDPFCNKVMNYHFPNSYQYEDIRTTDFTIWRGKLDLITGGDPCQPSSLAGQRKGKEDKRYLWPEYYRAIKEVLPAFIINENVPGTISNGMLDEKISDLEVIDYACWPPFVIPASAAGARHRRDRIWLVAYSNEIGRRGWRPKGGMQEEGEGKEQFKRYSSGEIWESGAICTANFCGMANGISGWMDRNKALGNAIVPQVAYQIFKAIELWQLSQE